MGLFDYFKKKEPVPQKEHAEDWQFSPTQAAKMLAQEDHYFSPNHSCDDFSKVEKKECTKCYNRKPLTQFSFLNKQKGTRNTWCKACFKEYDKERTAKKKLAKAADNLPPVATKTIAWTGNPDISLPFLTPPEEFKQKIAAIPKLAEFLEPSPTLTLEEMEQQLQDLLSDLDILATRVAFLQAELRHARQA